MGAAIAAILTYIFREHEEFSSTMCVAFGPGMFLYRGSCAYASYLRRRIPCFQGLDCTIHSYPQPALIRVL